MPDREKVMLALEHHKRTAVCNGCPYAGDDDTTEGYCPVYDDVIALLREQEPRVMTLDELTEIYVEFKGNACPVRLTNFDLQKIIMYADDGICRLWTAKPTDEQREAVKWDG